MVLNNLVMSFSERTAVCSRPWTTTKRDLLCTYVSLLLFCFGWIKEFWKARAKICTYNRKRITNLRGPWHTPTVLIILTIGSIHATNVFIKLRTKNGPS